MKKLSFILSSLILVLFVGCSEDQTTNAPEPIKSESNINAGSDILKSISINQDSLYYGAFTGPYQSALSGQRVSISDANNLVSFYDRNGLYTGYVGGNDVQTVLLNGTDKISLGVPDGFISIQDHIMKLGLYGSNTNIKLTSDNLNWNGENIATEPWVKKQISSRHGRTAKREITDKAGNVHTFVFENGLFVDELLNGISVFKQ